jgi:hypothetical protein
MIKMTIALNVVRVVYREHEATEEVEEVKEIQHQVSGLFPTN